MVAAVLREVDLRQPRSVVVDAIAESLRRAGATKIIINGSLVAVGPRGGRGKLEISATLEGEIWVWLVDWRTTRWRSAVKIMASGAGCAVSLLLHPTPDLEESMARLCDVAGQSQMRIYVAGHISGALEIRECASNARR